MVYNANNISVYRLSVLLLGEACVPGENHQQTLSHNVVSSIHRLSEIRTYNVSGDRHSLHR